MSNPDFGYLSRKRRQLSLSGRAIIKDLAGTFRGAEGGAAEPAARAPSALAAETVRRPSSSRGSLSVSVADAADDPGAAAGVPPAGRGNSRSRTASAASLASAAAQQQQQPAAPAGKHMEWLYRMVSAVHNTTGTYAYCDESREWLTERVDSADGEEVNDETEEEARWWTESSAAANGPAVGLGQEEDDDDEEEEEEEEAKSASPLRTETGSLADVPSLSLEAVLNSPVLRSDLRAYLEENFAAEGLSFLESLQQWGEVDPVAFPRRFVRHAQRMNDVYVDISADEMVNVPNETRINVRVACQGASSSSKLPEKMIRSLREAFAEVREQVLDDLRENAFARFLRSDEYREMLAVRFDHDSGGGATAASAMRARAWDAEKGYRAIQVRVRAAQGLLTRRKVWCHVAVDSRTYATQPASAGTASDGSALHTFGEDFEFPLQSTTQHVRLTVYSAGLLGGTGSGQFEGRAFVPVADAETQQGAELRVKLIPREYAHKVAGEVVVQFRMLQEEAVERPDRLVQEDDTSALADGIRGLVSKKKKRYKEDGFDLDLTYVTDRIIAMGYPSEGVEGVYRNNMEDVQRFFEQRHAKCYRLYNLCSERHYDVSKFHGRVVRYPFDDHNPPSMKTLKAFCRDVHAWLAEHPQNVAAIHCKAGKGRTGTVIGALFVHEGMSRNAREGLKYFARKRTKNQKGVTIPSQMRYVHYYDIYCRLRRAGRTAPPKASLFLQAVQLNYLPPSLESGDVWFTITQNGRKGLKYSSKGRIRVDRHLAKKALTLDFGAKPFLLSEDARIEFYRNSRFGKEKLFQCWFNTRYTTAIALQQYAAEKEQGRVRTERVSLNQRQVDLAKELDSSAVGDISFVEERYGRSYLRLVFSKWHLDKACKDKKNRNYPANFNAEFIFRQQRRHREAAEEAIATQWETLPFAINDDVIAEEEEHEVAAAEKDNPDSDSAAPAAADSAPAAGDAAPADSAAADDGADAVAKADSNENAADADDDDVLKVGNLLSVTLK